MTGSMATERSHMVNSIRSMTNVSLKEICRAEGLAVSGNKASLQERITFRIDELILANEREHINQIKRMIDGIVYPRSSPQGASLQTPRPSGFGSMPNGLMARTLHGPNLPLPGRSAGPSGGRQVYRSSPFYQIIESLAGPRDIPERPSNRDSINLTIQLSSNHVDQLRDSSFRVMLYCTATSLMTQYNALHDIAFPDVEVRVNNEEVKSNYKGLKNKPGTTKPADLTAFLRKSPPGFSNQLQFTWARTTKAYTIVVNLVKKTSAADLIERVRRGAVISKEKVIQEMVSRANDPDIVATSSILSLKDPISTMRMVTPCRSVVCTHNQCFDAEYFILLQEQAPTWTCPICNKIISYEALAVDHYVSDILKKTSSSVDQVTIEPDGQWHEVRQKEEKQAQSRAAYDNDSDDDDDLIELSGPDGKPASAVKSETAQATSGVAQTMTPLSSREASSRPNGAGAKRPSAVIDLTLSDDDEPPRPAKRQQSSASTMSTTFRPSINPPINLPEIRRPSKQSLQQHRLPALQTHQQSPQPQPPPPPSAGHQGASFGQASSGPYRPFSAQSYQPGATNMYRPAGSSMFGATPLAPPGPGSNGQPPPWPSNFAGFGQPWRADGASNADRNNGQPWSS